MTTETALQTARTLAPWGTTIYTISRHHGFDAQHISPLVVTEDSSIVDLSETLGEIGFERTPGVKGVRVAGQPRDAHEELVTRMSEALYDDPAELMHEQL